jgi:hypothetical protein
MGPIHSRLRRIPVGGVATRVELVSALSEETGKKPFLLRGIEKAQKPVKRVPL